MEKKILFSLFASLFLLSLVSALDVADVTYPTTVSIGDELDFDVFINNTNDLNNYTLTFKETDFDFSVNPVIVAANTTRTIGATYTVPSLSAGVHSINAEYANGSNAFTFTLNVSESPVLKITKVQELTFSQNGIVRVENTGNSKIDKVTMSYAGNAVVTFSDNDFSLNSGSSKDVQVSAANLNSLVFGNNVVTINALGDTSTASTSFTLAQTFCSAGSVGGNLTIRDVKINSDGDKDEEWKFLDTVTVEVEIKNLNKNDDMEDVFVELGLFDSSGNNVVSDLDFINDEEEEIDVGDIRDDDTETVEFEFRVPADIDAGNYKLAIKAYSDDLGQSNECVDFANDLSNDIYESVSIEEENDEGKFIGFDNVELSSDQLSCSESATLNFDAYNIGDDDQDRVKFTLFNNALGIRETYEITNNLDRGDDERVSFRFTTPSSAKDGDYVLYIDAEYDYKSGRYRESLDDPYEVEFELLGCSVAQTGSIASISTDYSSAKAGEEVTVDVTIRNLADEDKTFIINVDGYSSWAELVDVSDRTLTLESGESETIQVVLLINKDASSSESFTVSAIADAKTESRRVNLEIESAKGFSLGGNSLIWVIGLINLVLIVLIIIVAVKLSRR